MKKNSLHQTPYKQIIYEEKYSIDENSFNNLIPFSSFKTTIISKEKEINQKKKNSISSLINNHLLIYDVEYNCGLNRMIINNIVNNKKSHILTLYKEMLISLNQKQLMSRFYNFSESEIRIIKFENYYKHYIKFLAKPILRNIVFNSLIHENANQKAQIYFNNVYGKKKELKKKEEKLPIQDEIIFNTSIKEKIENYSTTMTCDSNEQLIYPSEIYKKCQEVDKKINKNNIINNNNNNYNNNKIIPSKKSSKDTSILTESDYLNCNKSNLFIMNGYNDFEDNESLLNIVKILRNNNNIKKNEKNEKRAKSNNTKKIKIENINLKKNNIQIEKTQIIKVQDLSKKNTLSPTFKSKTIIEGKSTSNPTSKKISFINNMRNSFINSENKTEIKSKKKKNATKSFSIIRNIKNSNYKNEKNNLKNEIINIEFKILNQITPRIYVHNGNTNFNNYQDLFKQRRCSIEKQKLTKTKTKIIDNISLTKNDLSLIQISNRKENRHNYISKSPIKREKILNNINNVNNEGKKFIRKNKKNSTLKITGHKKLLTAPSLNINNNNQFFSPKFLNIHHNENSNRKKIEKQHSNNNK